MPVEPFTITYAELKIKFHYIRFTC